MKIDLHKRLIHSNTTGQSKNNVLLNTSGKRNISQTLVDKEKLIFRQTLLNNVNNIMLNTTGQRK